MVVDAGIAYPTGDYKFKVFQPFPKVFSAEEVDPFLMCDEWGASKKAMGVLAPDPGPPQVLGERHVGWHPHRGFDILSYVKEGRGNHADSLGNVAIVRPGGIQWMRTGSGVEHAEGGGSPESANKHGFQIWINLPAEMKMSQPQYGTVQPEDIPELRSGLGVLSRILAGPGGASFTDRGDIHIADCELPARTAHQHLLSIHPDTLIVYVYHGEGTVGGRTLRQQQAAMFQVGEALKPHDDAHLDLQAGSDGFGVLIFAGQRLNQPIAWQGPIVMNTEEETRVAFSELRRGTFLKSRVSYDYKAEADSVSCGADGEH